MSEQKKLKNVTKAIEKLQQQIALIETIKQRERFSPEYKKWHRDTQVAIERIFGKEGRHLNDFTKIPYSLVICSSSTPDAEFVQAFRKGLDNAGQILNSMIDEIKEWGIDENDQAPVNATAIIENLCNRFHIVVRQLKSRHEKRDTLVVEDEYDVQDLLHSLLTLHFDDIRPEEWTPSYAGGCSRMDFLLKQEQIVVEVKKTRKTLGAKEVGEQLIIDIKKYEAHPDCRRIFCFVYDPEGWIANPRGIENDLNRDDGGLPVRVLITPI